MIRSRTASRRGSARGPVGDPIRWSMRQTEFGVLAMAATPRGVCLVEFGDDATAIAAAMPARLCGAFPDATVAREPDVGADVADSAVVGASRTAPPLAAWMAALDAHVTTGAPRPAVPLDLRGSPFQLAVWQALLDVPAGVVVPYGAIARAVGRPAAVRAVGTACGANRLAVLIPCHRVVRADGGLGGYRWGVARKQALLDRERVVGHHRA